MIGIFVSLLADPSVEAQFNEVYHKYIDLLNSLAFRITNDEELTKEAVNITLTKISLRFEKLILEDENKPGSLKSYMCEAVKNNAINLAKSKKRRSEKVTLVSNFDFIDEDLKYKQFSNEKNHQIYLDAVEFILNMPQTQRRVLTLRFVFNMEIKDIAEDMNLPIGTVKSRLNRGIKMLKVYFGVESN